MGGGWGRLQAICQILQYYNPVLLIKNHNVHCKFSFKKCITIPLLMSTCLWVLFLKCHVFVCGMINIPLRIPVADLGGERDARLQSNF